MSAPPFAPTLPQQDLQPEAFVHVGDPIPEGTPVYHTRNGAKYQNGTTYDKPVEKVTGWCLVNGKRRIASVTVHPGASEWHVKAFS